MATVSPTDLALEATVHADRSLKAFSARRAVSRLSARPTVLNAEPFARLEVVSPTSGPTHSRVSDDNGRLRFGRPSLRTYAQALVGAELNAGRVVRRRTLRPQPRVGQLAHLQPAICERFSIHAEHLAVSGRARLNMGDGFAT